jgi:hypothetical protein
VDDGCEKENAKLSVLDSPVLNRGAAEMTHMTRVFGFESVEEAGAVVEGGRIACSDCSRDDCEAKRKDLNESN